MTISLLMMMGPVSIRAQNNCVYTPYNKSFTAVNCQNNGSGNYTLINNGSFESGFLSWELNPDASRIVLSGNANSGNSCAELKSLQQSAGDVLLSQTTANYAPGSTHQMTAYMRSPLSVNNNQLSATMQIRINYPNGNYTILSKVCYPTQNWNKYTFDFTVPATSGALVTMAQVFVYRGQQNSIWVDDVAVDASNTNNINFAYQPEMLINSNVPTAPAGIFYDNFKGTVGDKLACDKWLAVKKTWGNSYTLNNNGVVPENLELVCGGGLRFHGHGDLYNGNIVGATTHLGNGKIRVGACVATKNYYASGLYEVEAKLTPGMVNAFWTFHYIEDANYQQGAIKNTEIDWEFPSNIYNGPKQTIQDGLCNSWGGLCNGEGFHSTTSVNSMFGDLSQAFHTYKIEWHTGGNGINPEIKWYIDSVLVKTESNPLHVPFRASRFWLGVWYGNSNWITGGDASVLQYSDKFMEVKSVKITPFYEANDVYENETDPFVGYVYANQNPAYPCTANTNAFVYKGQPAQPYTNEFNDLNIKANWNQGKIGLSYSTNDLQTISQVQVYDIKGQLMFKDHPSSAWLQQDSWVIMPHTFIAGMYIIKIIHTDGAISYQKISGQ